MAVQAKADAVPKNISEEYYQISSEILTSFSKYRPPVDLFVFREDISQLYPLSRKGSRLSNEQVDQVQVLCEAGNLFVSRTDHPIYSGHIAKQVGLVLVDANLTEAEVADIMIRALSLRLDEFIDQPVLASFEVLYRDLMVFTEYVWQDKHRIKLFMRRLGFEHSLTRHSINSLSVGAWLYLHSFSEDNQLRRQFDRLCLGLYLHDFGMSKLPAFILGKSTMLKSEDREKIVLHPSAGLKSLQKLNIGFDELNQAVMEHHERLDGSGYPQKVKDVSKIGRLVAVADSFSAMITKRVYAPAKKPLEACKELAADKARYEAQYTTVLLHAYMTETFGKNT